jgi:hypothetical protein
LSSREGSTSFALIAEAAMVIWDTGAFAL